MKNSIKLNKINCKHSIQQIITAICRPLLCVIMDQNPVYYIRKHKCISLIHEAGLLKKRILVVDDDEDLLFSYRLILDKADYEVFTANDVDVAQDIMKQEDIDLAILDYMMPKLTGDRLARRIKVGSPETKIIFVSGYNEVIDVAKSLEFKVQGVFMKPFDPVILEKMVETGEFNNPFKSKLGLPTKNMYPNK